MKRDGCPVTGIGANFNPFQREFLLDPFPFLQLARADQPAFYCPEIDYWVVTRFEDVKAVFNNHKTYTAENTISPIVPFSQTVVDMLQDGGYSPEPVLSNNVPPNHTRIRSQVSKLFTPMKMQHFLPELTQIVNQQIDGFIEKGQADIVKAFTYDVPALVLLHILGVPKSDVPRVKAWAGNRIKLYYGRPTPDEQIELTQRLIPFWKYTQALVAEKLNNPQDDLVSDLIRMRDGSDEALTVNEICSCMITLLVAGHETTTAQMTNGLYHLLSQRDKWESLCKDASRIPNAVEEILRYDPSVCAWRRLARRATQIGGINIPKNANLLLMLNSANRDDLVFDQANELQLTRPNASKHLTFGYGIHFCVGAPLARLELRVVLEELVRRMPHLRLVPNQELDYVPNISFRGPLQLEVAWDNT